MSSFDDDDYDGGKQEETSDNSREMLIRTLEFLLKGGTFGADDDRNVYVLCEDAILLKFETRTFDGPIVRIEQKTWKACEDSIPSSIADPILSGELNRDPKESARVLFSLLEEGYSFSARISVWVSGSGSKKKGQELMSDRDARMKRVLDALTWKLFHYDGGDEDTERDLLDLVIKKRVSSQESDPPGRGWSELWTVTIDSDTWVQNWNDSLYNLLDVTLLNM